MTTALLRDLEARGLIHNSTDLAELGQRLDAGMQSVYYGIDPTSSSMHVGNLIGVLVLRRFQDAGHRPIGLVGGSTGMVGDPSGRSDERNLLDADALAVNVAGIRGQLERLVDFSDERAVLVNNYDWTFGVGVLDFLRDVGKYVTVNQMMAKESVKARLASETGISYTEFSYMLLQAFDFWWLHENHDCFMQIGGSDQWGNIVAGIDLVRRRSQGSAHGLTWPLITRADGAKFGKTADGAIWLDANRTLPYDFHQYFLRVDDSDVEKFLLQLTLLPLSDIDDIVTEHGADPSARVGQRRLADEVTALVHGPEAVVNANLAAAALFGSDPLTAEMAAALRGIAPETSIAASLMGEEQNLVTMLVATGLCSSRSDARRKLGENQISVNRVKTASDSVADGDFLSGKYLLVQRGKKARHLVVVDP